MERKSIIIVISFFFIFFNQLYSQKYANRIIGKITIKNSQEPIPNANIYLSGTLWGTASDSNGDFELRSIYPGEHELVVSVIGFETKTKIISLTKKSEIEINFSLKPTNIELETVEVVAEKAEDWYRDYRIFKNVFIGFSDNSSYCEIKNKLQINFSRKNKNILVATSNYPLLILNEALGYEIECELVTFTFNTVSRRLQYVIKTYFKEMKSRDEDQQEEWEENRQTAYRSSMEFFIKCLFHSNFRENGFKVSESYYPSKDHQLLHSELLESESLLKPAANSGYKIIKFDRYLQVTDMESELNPRPISWISLIYDEATLDEYGYSVELVPFETRGYWASLGVADLLPKYFDVITK